MNPKRVRLNYIISRIFCQMKMDDYIPFGDVDLETLATDIEERRRKFQHDTFAKLIGIERPAFTQKLAGQRKWKLYELVSVASQLGKDYKDYFQDSHSDAAS